MPNKSAFLRTVGIFSDLSEAQLATLAEHFELREYQAGDTIIHQGEVSDTFFVIESGFVNITRGPKDQEVFISALAAGEYFGEAALFQDVKRTANVVAYEPLRLLTIQKSAFIQYLKSHPPGASLVLYQMLKELFHRLEQTSAELQFERKESVTQSSIDKLLK